MGPVLGGLVAPTQPAQGAVLTPTVRDLVTLATTVRSGTTLTLTEVTT